MKYISVYESAAEGIVDPLFKSILTKVLSTELIQYIKKHDIHSIQTFNGITVGISTDSIFILSQDKKTGEISGHMLPYYGKLLHVEKIKDDKNEIVYNVYSTAGELDENDNLKVVLDQSKLSNDGFKISRRLTINWAISHNLINMYTSDTHMLIGDEEDNLELIDKKDIITNRYGQFIKSRSFQGHISTYHEIYSPSILDSIQSLLGMSVDSNIPFIAKIFKNDKNPSEAIVYSYGGSERASNISRISIDTTTNTITSKKVFNSDMKKSSIEAINMYYNYCEKYNKDHGYIILSSYDGKRSCINYEDNKGIQKILVLENIDGEATPLIEIITSDFTANKCIKTCDENGNEFYILINTEDYNEISYVCYSSQGELVNRNSMDSDQGKLNIILSLFNFDVSNISSDVINSPMDLNIIAEEEEEEDEEDLEDIDFNEDAPDLDYDESNEYDEISDEDENFNAINKASIEETSYDDEIN